MKNQIIPYRQSLSYSCLAANLLMLLKTRHGIDFNEKDEHQITLRGMKRTYPFYVVGIPEEFFNKYEKKVRVMDIVADNKRFAKILSEWFNGKNFKVSHKKITIPLIREMLKGRQLICHIDNNYLGDYSHSSHFIILEKAAGKRILIVDPMEGKKRFISEKKPEDSILSLKKRIKMCPLLFYI